MLSIATMESSFLSLLLNSAARWCGGTAIGRLWTAATAFLLCGTLVIVAAVIIVVVDLHLPRCRLVHWCLLGRRWTLFLLSRRCRGTWRGRLVDGLHGRERLRRRRRGRVVGSLRRVVCRGWALFVHSPHLRRTAVGRGGHLERLRGLTLHLDFIKPRACLISSRSLDACVILPFANALRRSAAGPLLPITRGSISRELRVGRWRCSASNLRHARVGVVLVRSPRESTTRRRCRIVDDGTDLSARALLAVEWRDRSVARGWRNTIGWGTALAEQWRRALTRRSLLLRRALGCSESRVLRWEIGGRWLVRSRVLVLRRRRETTMGRRRRTLRLLLVWSESILTRRAWCTGGHWWLRLWHAIAVVILVERWRRCWRVLQLGDPVASPVAASGKGWWWRTSRSAIVCLCTSPWLTRWTAERTRLVCLRVDILRQGSARLIGKTIGGLTLKQCQTCLDVDIGGIEISSPGVCVECIACLVVARLVKRAKVVPNLRDIGVKSDGARVCVKRIAVLVDLVV